MIADEDYFFFALEATGRVTAFRAAIGQETLSQVKGNLARIEQSTTTEAQYHRALSSCAENPEPEGTLLHWVCRDNIDYLDLTKDRLALHRICVYNVAPPPHLLAGIDKEERMIIDIHNHIWTREHLPESWWKMYSTFFATYITDSEFSGTPEEIEAGLFAKSYDPIGSIRSFLQPGLLALKQPREDSKST